MSIFCFLITSETCRCPKVLKTAWTSMIPLVHHKNGSLSGIMPKFINESVISCCGNCSLGQGPSTIDWYHDASNASSTNRDRQSLMNAVLAGTHITMPFFKDTASAKGSPSTPYDYIPFLKSPGMAFFKRRPTRREVGNQIAADLVQSLLSLYPLFIVVIIFITLAGLVFWLLVSFLQASKSKC